MKNTTTNNIQKVKDDLIAELDKRIADKIIEKTNADLLKKLIEQADTINEAIMIAELGTTYKRTGFHFDKRLEKTTDTIKYFKKNEKLSFVQKKSALTHKLIIGDNYDALLNLLIEYRGKIDVIYIDPPYGKDSMGEFAKTNYENAITRDNLLSMLYPRLVLARQLLSKDGIIFCSIDDKNQAYVKGLFDEVFGESNFVANFIIDKTAQGANQSNTFKTQHEYLILYTKNDDSLVNSDLQNEINIKKFKYSDEKGIYAITNSFDSINSPLTANKNRGYTVYYNPITQEAKVRDEYDRIKNIFGKIDEVLKKNGFVAIRPGVRNNIQYPWNWKKERFLSDYKKDLVFQKNQKGEWAIYHKNRASGFTKDTTIKKFDTRQDGNGSLTDILNEKLFNYPKSVEMMKWVLTKMDNKYAIILDFFAGSGTTGQALMELNKQDGGKRQFILATANEITDSTPNGIVYDVTSKRLKRIMTGECYDGTKNFKWNEKNKPLGDNLDVYDIATVAPYSDKPFTQIDEILYGKEKLGVNEKIKWVCENFEGTQKTIKDK